ncbi:MAG: WD40 repeat domain-containing protein [Polyangiales bacterium]
MTPRDVVAPTDIVTPADVQAPRDVVTGPDAGPVAAGVYEYTAIRPETLVNPVAVAWHPSGGYALILSSNDGVFRFDAASRAITRVASTTTTNTWRGLTFAPDGSRAILFGYTGAMGTSRVGRIYNWDPLTSALTDRGTTEQISGGTYESLAWAPGGGRGALLATRQNTGSASIKVWNVDASGNRGTPIFAYGIVASTGCDDLDWITDGFGDPALAVVCGTNTGRILVARPVDGTPVVADATSSGNTGNVSRIASHPMGNLALAIGSSTSKLYRVRDGQWFVGFNSPLLTGTFDVAFSTDGRRAAAFGGLGRVWEFRTDLYSASDILDVSMPSLTQPPYNQPSSGTTLRGLAWRPGCDEGLVVGGSSTISGTTAFVAYFRVTNGRACN